MELNDSNIGMKVNIKRSGGSKQLGAISKINHEKRIVLVEWEEDNLSKAKEATFDQLFLWNSDIFQPQNKVEKKTSEIVPPISGRKTTVFEKIDCLKKRIKPDEVNIVDTPKDSKLSPQKAQFDLNKIINAKKQINVKKPLRRSVARTSLSAKRHDVESSKKKTVKYVEVPIESEGFDTQSPYYDYYNMIENFRNECNFDNSRIMESKKSLQICVCIRKRPFNSKEISTKEIDVVTIPNSYQTLVHECKEKLDLSKYLETHKFNFDYCFNESCKNSTIYHYTAKPLVNCIFEGGQATCFAYGQTGSGKTYTMGGNYFAENATDSSEDKGIYDYASKEILRKLKSNSNMFLTVSVYEIYGTKVLDLLNNKEQLRILEDGQGSVKVRNLKEIRVSEEEEIQYHIREALKIRSSGKTSANANSSRSHAIIQFCLHKKGGKNENVLVGKLSLIDLAGNERGADNNLCDRNTRMEGAEINKSLLALKECIRALGRKSAYLPFRGSKLTQVLKDSFLHEKAKTCMIATISPGIQCCENTLNTLHYADRLKQINERNLQDSNDNIKIDNKDCIQQLESEKNKSDSKFDSAEIKPVLKLDKKISQRNIKSKSKQNISNELAILNDKFSEIMDNENKVSNKENISIKEYVDQLEVYISEKLSLLENFHCKLSELKELLNEKEFSR